LSVLIILVFKCIEKNYVKPVTALTSVFPLRIPLCKDVLYFWPSYPLKRAEIGSICVQISPIYIYSPAEQYSIHFGRHIKAFVVVVVRWTQVDLRSSHIRCFEQNSEKLWQSSFRIRRKISDSFLSSFR